MPFFSSSNTEDMVKIGDSEFSTKDYFCSSVKESFFFFTIFVLVTNICKVALLALFAVLTEAKFTNITNHNFF